MIELIGVSFACTNGKQEASLQGINLTIDSAEVVLLRCESGCGERTITRLINGLIPNYYEGWLAPTIFAGMASAGI